MESLRFVWGMVVDLTANVYHYFFPMHNAQLLLEYVMLEEDLSSNYVNTETDTVLEGKNKKRDVYKPDQNKCDDLLNTLVTNQQKSTKIGNGSEYTFLFDHKECCGK